MSEKYEPTRIECHPTDEINEEADLYCEECGNAITLDDHDKIGHYRVTCPDEDCHAVLHINITQLMVVDVEVEKSFPHE